MAPVSSGHSSIDYFFLNHFLHFWHNKVFQAHLALFLPQESAVSPRSLVLFSVVWYLEAKVQVLGVLMAAGLFLSPTLSVGRVRDG